MMMAACMGLILLLYVSWRLSGSLLSPPCLFALSWSLAVGGLFASRQDFYPVSLMTLLVYLCGAGAFSCGSLLALYGQRRDDTRQMSPAPPMARNLLDIGLIVVVISFPLYWRWVTADLRVSDPMLVMTALRAEAIQNPRGGTFSPVANLVTLATFIALAMACEDDGTRARRWRTVLAVVAAVLYGSATGAKGHALVLIVALFTISSIRSGRLNLRRAIVVLVITTCLFCVGLRFVNFAYLDFTSTSAMLSLLLKTVRSYWLGGVVAFDRIVNDPLAVESTQRLNRFLLETANSLGAHYTLPSWHAPFTDISSSLDTNVYTIYYSYYLDGGILGVCIGLGVTGYVVGMIYRFARRGSSSATMIYGILAGAILMSIQAEHFVLGLNLLLKAVLFLGVVYGLAGRKRAWALPPAMERA